MAFEKLPIKSRIIMTHSDSETDQEQLLDDDDCIDYQDLAIKKTLGKGNFGVVYLADFFGTDVAIKHIYEAEDYDVKKYFLREVKTLMKCRHPNIVQYLGYALDNKKMHIVMEYVCNGDVGQWIENETIDHAWRFRISFILDTLKALALLHSRSIIHRDLKCDNMLLTDNLRVKITDFGLSRKSPKTESQRKRQSYCGTDAYMAPEIFLCMNFDESLDMFSFAVIVLELIFLKIAKQGGHIFQREIPGFGLKKDVIREEVGELCAECPKELVEIVLKCANIEPSLRPEPKHLIDPIRDIENTLPGLKNVHVEAKIIKRTEDGFTGIEKQLDELELPNPHTRLKKNTSKITLSKDQIKNGKISGAKISIKHEDKLGIGHDIPDRFSINKGLFAKGKMASACARCHKSISMLLGNKSLKCDECGICAHNQSAKLLSTQ